MPEKPAAQESPAAQNLQAYHHADLVLTSPDALDAAYLEMALCHKGHQPYIIGSEKEAQAEQALVLRESAAADFDDLYAIFRDSDMLMFPEAEADKAAQRNCFLEYIEQQYVFFDFGFWTIENGEGQVFGWCGFHQQADEVPELGYIVRLDKRRQHVALRACRMALAFMRDVIGAHSVQIRVERGNTASAALAERLGFIRTGQTAASEQVYSAQQACCTQQTCSNDQGPGKQSDAEGCIKYMKLLS